jgi:4-hydroxy-tetrahydrodipicolinate reductase
LHLLLIGHGRMGRLIESLASSHGATIAGVVTSRSGAAAIATGEFGDVDVAIDFSQPPAVRASLEQLAARKIDVVIGTTGWQAEEPACREIASRAGIGVLASANFSLGMHIFREIVERAATLFGSRNDVGAWIHELHHSAKKDAPSGTALMLQAAMASAPYPRGIDVSSTRAGAIPGTHTVGFDGPAETVTLTHTVRDRAVFAHGALEAAKWLKGRRGWFTVQDMIRE